MVEVTEIRQVTTKLPVPISEMNREMCLGEVRTTALCLSADVQGTSAPLTSLAVA